MANAFADAPRYSVPGPDATRYARLPWYLEGPSGRRLFRRIVHVAREPDPCGSHYLDSTGACMASCGSAVGHAHSASSGMATPQDAWPVARRLEPPQGLASWTALAGDPSTHARRCGYLINHMLPRIDFSCPRSWIRPRRTTSATMSIRVPGYGGSVAQRHTALGHDEAAGGAWVRATACE